MDWRKRLLIGSICGLTFFYWLILLIKFPLFKAIPGYFWHFLRLHEKPLPDIWLIIPIAIISAIAIFLVTTKIKNRLIGLCVIIVTGYILQIGLIATEDSGLGTIEGRLHYTGHAEFVRIAASEPGFWEVAGNYEEFIKQDSSYQYVHSKPPGQLLFYMLIQKGSNLFDSRLTHYARYQRLVSWVVFLFPLISYLVIIPLYYLGRMYFDDKTALFTCLLYLFTPSTALVVFHLDQVLYPFLFIGCALLALHAVRSGKWLFAFFAGASVYLAAYFSFLLLPVIIVSLLPGVFKIIGSKVLKSDMVNYANFLIRFFSGMFISFVIFLMLFDYNPLTRFENAMAYHEVWKNWQPGFYDTFKYGLLNYIEISIWVGFPIFILFLANSWKSISDTIRMRFEAINLPAIAAVIIFLMLLVLGKTKGEVGRLWIFIIPLVCLGAAGELTNRFGNKADRVFGLVLLLQYVSIILIKKQHDFW